MRWETLEAANSWDINLSKNQRVVSEHIKIGPDRTFLAKIFGAPKRPKIMGWTGRQMSPGKLMVKVTKEDKTDVRGFPSK